MPEYMPLMKFFVDETDSNGAGHGKGKGQAMKTLFTLMIFAAGISGAAAQTDQQKQGEPQDQANSARIDTLNTENGRRVQENADRMRQQQKRDELESRIRKLEQGQ